VHHVAGDFNIPPKAHTSTVLLSRKNADQIGEFSTPLPPNCIVDCIYDAPNHTLWILDVLKWKDQTMIDCEASFRFWWRDAKLSLRSGSLNSIFV